MDPFDWTGLIPIALFVGIGALWGSFAWTWWRFERECDRHFPDAPRAGFGSGWKYLYFWSAEADPLLATRPHVLALKRRCRQLLVASTIVWVAGAGATVVAGLVLVNR